MLFCQIVIHRIVIHSFPLPCSKPNTFVLAVGWSAYGGEGGKETSQVGRTGYSGTGEERPGSDCDYARLRRGAHHNGSHRGEESYRIYLISFSRLCLGFSLLLFPATIPCIIVFSEPLCRVAWPKYLRFWRFTKLYAQFVGWWSSFNIEELVRWAIKSIRDILR